MRLWCWLTTPGLPLEWIYAALRLGPRRRKKLRAMIDATQSGDYPDWGRENAASVVTGDGLAMIAAVAPRYAGAAPLWTQLELQADPRSDAAVALALGVDRKKVCRWRRNAVFDPWTGVRLVPNRGTRVV